LGNRCQRRDGHRRLRSRPTLTSVRSHESIMAYYAHTAGYRRFRVHGETANLVWSRSRARLCSCVSSSVLVFFHTFPSPVLSPLQTITALRTRTQHTRSRVFSSYGFRIGLRCACCECARMCVYVCVRWCPCECSPRACACVRVVLPKRTKIIISPCTV